MQNTASGQRHNIPEKEKKKKKTGISSQIITNKITSTYHLFFFLMWMTLKIYNANTETDTDRCTCIYL